MIAEVDELCDTGGNRVSENSLEREAIAVDV